MDATCCLSAAPLPQTACLTSFGVGSSISDLRLCGGKERHAARLADRHRGLHVALEEEALDRRSAPDGARRRSFAAPRAAGEGVPSRSPVRIGADAAGVHEAQRAGFELDHAEAADGGPGIDAERDHARMVARATGSVRSDSYRTEGLTAYGFCRTMSYVRNEIECSIPRSDKEKVPER